MTKTQAAEVLRQLAKALVAAPAPDVVRALEAAEMGPLGSVPSLEKAVRDSVEALTMAVVALEDGEDSDAQKDGDVP
jgi:hypothetical protein